MEEQKQKVIDALKEGKSVLVTVRRDPSLDQLSACIALTLILNELGKHGTAVFSGKVPASLEFLEAAKTLQKTPDSLQDFIISLDKAKADKLRYKVEDNVVKIYITPYKVTLTPKDLEFSYGDFNVDIIVALGVHRQEDLDEAITAHGRILHDATIISLNTDDKAEEELGSVSWVDTDASSLSEMVAGIANELGKEDAVDSQVATALLAGIVAETGQFGNGKTKPHTLEMAAKLLAAGANQELVSSKLGSSAVARPTEPKEADKEETKPGSDGATSLPDLGELDLTKLTTEPTPEVIAEPAAEAAEPETKEAGTKPLAEEPAAPAEAEKPAASQPELQPAAPKKETTAVPKAEAAPQDSAAVPAPAAAIAGTAGTLELATPQEPAVEADKPQQGNKQDTGNGTPATLSHKRNTIMPPSQQPEEPLAIQAAAEAAAGPVAVPGPGLPALAEPASVPAGTPPVLPAMPAAQAEDGPEAFAQPVLVPPVSVAPGGIDAPAPDEQAALDYLKGRKVSGSTGAKVQPLHGHGQGGYLGGGTPKIGPAIPSPSETAQAETLQVDSSKFALTPPSMGGTLTANLPSEEQAASLDTVVKQAANTVSAPILERGKPGLSAPAELMPDAGSAKPAADTKPEAQKPEEPAERSKQVESAAPAGPVEPAPNLQRDVEKKAEIPPAAAPMAALLDSEETAAEKPDEPEAAPEAAVPAGEQPKIEAAMDNSVPGAEEPKEDAKKEEPAVKPAGKQPKMQAAMDDTPPPEPHPLKQEQPAADDKPAKQAGPLQAGLLESQQDAPEPEPKKEEPAASAANSTKPQPTLQAGLAEPGPEPSPAAQAPADMPSSPPPPTTAGLAPPDLQAALANDEPSVPSAPPPPVPPPINAVPV